MVHRLFIVVKPHRFDRSRPVSVLHLNKRTSGRLRPRKWHRVGRSPDHMDCLSVAFAKQIEHRQTSQTRLSSHQQRHFFDHRLTLIVEQRANLRCDVEGITRTTAFVFDTLDGTLMFIEQFQLVVGDQR